MAPPLTCTSDNRKIVTVHVRDRETNEPVKAVSFIADTRAYEGEALLPFEWKGVELSIHVWVRD